MRYILTTMDGKHLTLTSRGLAFVEPAGGSKPLTYTLAEAQAEAQRITRSHPTITITITEYK